MGKLLILGLDGLEISYVEKLRLKYFMQKEYGTHYIGFMNKYYTPLIWGSFLTGLHVEWYGYNYDQCLTKRQLEALPSILRPLYKIKKKILGSRKLGIRDLLQKLGIANPYPPSILPENLLKLTFPEILKELGYKVVCIEVPGYNEQTGEYWRGLISQYFTKSLQSRYEVLKKVLDVSKERLEKAIYYMLMKYDLIFIYVPIPDLFHHLLYSSKSWREKVKLINLYLELHDACKKVIDFAYDKNYKVLIVSDHGFDENVYHHSECGFWSVNFELPFKPRTVLDFKKLILYIITKGG